METLKKTVRFNFRHYGKNFKSGDLLELVEKNKAEFTVLTRNGKKLYDFWFTKQTIDKYLCNT